jgi:RNA polymerase sigma-70 factor (ECF subfamily)
LVLALLNTGKMLNDTAPCDTAQLFREYAAHVGRWAARLSGSPSDTEDIVQEVFLAVHRQQAAARDIRSPPAWLLQITKNVVRHVWRTRWRAARRADALDRDAPVAAAPDPLAELERRRAAEHLHRALEALDHRYRQVYWLSEIQGLPSSTVAALTGLSPEALRVRRFRARRQLAQHLVSQGVD